MTGFKCLGMTGVESWDDGCVYMSIKHKTEPTATYRPLPTSLQDLFLQSMEPTFRLCAEVLFIFWRPINAGRFIAG